MTCVSAEQMDRELKPLAFHIILSDQINSVLFFFSFPSTQYSVCILYSVQGEIPINSLNAHIPPPAEFTEAFETFDVDDDGSISSKELKV